MAVLPRPRAAAADQWAVRATCFADLSATPWPKAQQRHVSYDTILNWADFDRWLARLQAAPLVALDTETTSLDPLRATLVGLSFSVQPGEAAYLPLHQ